MDRHTHRHTDTHTHTHARTHAHTHTHTHTHTHAHTHTHTHRHQDIAADTDKQQTDEWAHLTLLTGGLYLRSGIISVNKC